MRVVIQCAATKNPSAGSLLAPNGQPVLFVAQPDAAPKDGVRYFARPDDPADDGRTWRVHLLDYNGQPGNPQNLLPAYQLYAHRAYRALADTFGVEQVFILSAGWGLISAGFLTPRYDITFTASAESWKRRRRVDFYDDFCMMPDDGAPIAFVGGKEYLPLFCTLSGHLRCRKTVFFNSARQPQLPPGFEVWRYRTRTRTNWHYECALALAAGSLDLDLA